MSKLVIFFFWLLVTVQQVQAQNTGSIIEAEKAFAKSAIRGSIRKAFLANLDSSGVVFNEGKISNGIQQFTAAPENSLKLLWTPQFALTSLAGDLGFTTGPYELRKSLETEAIGAGQYSSVWIRNAKGEWKLLVDLGITFPNSLYEDSLTSFSFTGATPDKSQEYLDIETKFIHNYESKGPAAFRNKILDSSWFNLQSQRPLFGKANILASLTMVPNDLNFSISGYGVSFTRDFVYAYGTIMNSGKQGNYLRVWVHTRKGWMILLQVIK